MKCLEAAALFRVRKTFGSHLSSSYGLLSCSSVSHRKITVRVTSLHGVRVLREPLKNLKSFPCLAIYYYQLLALCGPGNFSHEPTLETTVTLQTRLLANFCCQRKIAWLHWTHRQVSLLQVRDFLFWELHPYVTQQALDTPDFSRLTSATFMAKTATFDKC